LFAIEEMTMRWIAILSLALMWPLTVSAVDAPSYGRLYTVDDAQYHLYCTGQGSPTVLLEAGVGGFSMNWYAVQPELSQHTRVCSYDRLGYGWSQPLNARHNPTQAVGDLHQLLANAGESAPYIMVGHSYGGVLVRAYQAAYPNDVVGIVLVDAVHPQLAASVPFYPDALERQLATLEAASGWMRWAIADRELPIPLADQFPESYQAAYTDIMLSESFFKASAAEAHYMVTELPKYALPDTVGDLPLVVLSHGLPEPRSFLGAPATREQAALAEGTWQQLQADLVTLSPYSRQVIAESSGHNIQFEQPELVIEAVLSVLARAH
jgi:pimeloyl-ACP methyl ester carboxylesterase